MRLKVKNCYDIQNDINKNQIDLGIHYQVDGNNSFINIITLTEFEVGLVASPSFQLSERNFDRKNQLKKCNLINNDANSVYQSQFLDYMKCKNIKTEQSIELWSIEATKKNIINNLGIACLPLFVVQEEIESQEIIRIRINGFKPKGIAAHH